MENKQGLRGRIRIKVIDFVHFLLVVCVQIHVRALMNNPMVILCTKDTWAG